MDEASRHHLQKLTAYELFTKDSDLNEPIPSNISDNKVASLFFSEHNISILHEGIRYKVYMLTNRTAVIDRQSDVDLRVIMRSVYLQYARHLPYRVVDQVKELNTRVLDFAVPRIVMEIDQYANYTMHASTLPVPLEHSKNMSSKGDKVLQMKSL